MATKTFKIGLSNTDKQNMAQDVYERLLALTFPEYDTDTEYSVGDFVVYNDQLYKCIGATTGAWDSSKWQLATLNDLLTDIEDAVQFVNDKANVDGNYPTMTVGVADNLSPYDENSGTDQDEPFNFQASGTKNGSDATAVVGALAIMKEKRGNTVVVNQHAPSVASGNYYAESGTVTFSDGVATFTASAGNGRTSVYIPRKANHKYLFMVTAKLTTLSPGDIAAIQVYQGSGGGWKSVMADSTSWKTYFLLVEQVADVDNTDYTRIIQDFRSGNYDAIQYKDVYCIDLTQWFNGNANIPQDLLDNQSNFFRYYQGSLASNTGELVNANSRYLKAIGRNQWDEEYLNGYYDESADGSFNPYGNWVASKNPIKVIPNTTYFLRTNGKAAYVLFYDKDNNYLGSYTYLNDRTFVTPSDCLYIKFDLSYGSNTYNHDITLSIYYEGESGYDQYYPYELLTNNDTGVEVLRSAGNVADIKLPDGTIKRNIGVVDLGSLTWTYNTTLSMPTFIAELPGGKHTGSTAAIKCICPKYVSTLDGYAFETLPVDKMIAAGSGYWAVVSLVEIHDSSYNNAADFKTAMSGVYLFYELETPTEEQGTPYSENIAIDDFGTMDFSGTSGVPQGNALFYPVDYKAYLDTLHNYTDGDPANLALKSGVSCLYKHVCMGKTQDNNNIYSFAFVSNSATPLSGSFDIQSLIHGGDYGDTGLANVLYIAVYSQDGTYDILLGQNYYGVSGYYGLNTETGNIELAMGGAKAPTTFNITSDLVTKL